MSTNNENKWLPVVLEITATVKHYWWQFFDWLAVISWRYLILVSLSVLVLGSILDFGSISSFFVYSSVLIKILAGGKRRAEIAAKNATDRANVEALERRVLEAEMATLQAQIEPHFLFNTLALISQLIETDPQEASKVHAHLIKYLRAALPQMREKGGGKLGQQLELCRAYLNIMQARMQERLTYSIECPTELEHASFPSMMIQTLVENAIKHGLEPKTDGGHISIIASQGENEILVDVKDNGMGFDLYAKDGIGLSNIRERLKVIFGLKASLSIEIPKEGGAQFTIHVPSIP